MLKNGANLVQNFTARYERCENNTNSSAIDDFRRFWHLKMLYRKLQEIITALRRLFRYTKSSASAGLFVFYKAVLFTFGELYGIITLGSYLLDKLEFDIEKFLYGFDNGEVG